MHKRFILRQVIQVLSFLLGPPRKERRGFFTCAIATLIGGIVGGILGTLLWGTIGLCAALAWVVYRWQATGGKMNIRDEFFATAIMISWLSALLGLLCWGYLGAVEGFSYGRTRLTEISPGKFIETERRS